MLAGAVCHDLCAGTGSAAYAWLDASITCVCLPLGYVLLSYITSMHMPYDPEHHHNAGGSSWCSRKHDRASGAVVPSLTNNSKQ
jgi:hypothetical protein